MALVNHAKKEINAKIVYYGPAGTGKNAALSYIYSRIKPTLRGDLKNVPAGTDNLLFFDFSPFETPLPNGYRVRLHVYTLTGIVTNPATWKMTLKGADGIIIMVNPAVEHAAESRESVSQLRDFLSAYGVGLHDTPAVLQLNSLTPLHDPAQIAEIGVALELSSLASSCSNSANGEGLLEALTSLSRQILDRVRAQEDPCEMEAATPNVTIAPETTTAPLPEVLEYVEEAPLHPDDSPQVSVLSREIVSEGGIIRIPLHISQGNTRRRLLVTVNVELEMD